MVLRLGAGPAEPRGPTAAGTSALGRGTVSSSWEAGVGPGRLPGPHGRGCTATWRWSASFGAIGASFSPWAQFASGPPPVARPAHAHDPLSVLSGVDRPPHSRYRTGATARPGLITPE